MTKTQRAIVVVGVLVLGVLLHARYCEWEFEWLEPADKIIIEAFAFVSLGPVHLLPDGSVLQLTPIGLLEEIGLGSFILLGREGYEERVAQQWVGSRSQEIQAARGKAFWGGIVAPVLMCGVAAFLGIPSASTSKIARLFIKERS